MPLVDLTARLRTAGEILDDAWRLYLADLPLLLALTAVFTAPGLVACWWILVEPASTAWWLEGLEASGVALLLLLTGLGSAACQAAFHLRFEGSRPTLRACLNLGLRRAWHHAAGRGFLLLAVCTGSWFLLVPGLLAYLGLASVHALLIEKKIGIWEAIQASRREAQRQPGKAAAVVLTRPFLLAIVVVNLYSLTQLALWMAENLGGFDVAYLSLLCSRSNLAYLALLCVFGWLLTAPYAEAANYLFHLDSRVRFEGLDLWHRVRQHFPALPRQGVLAILALALVSLLACRATAADERLEPIRSARQELQAMSKEVADANPYPGSGRWAAELRQVAGRLDGHAPPTKSRYRWFHKAIRDFASRDRDGAMQVLQGLDRRLAILEDGMRGATEAPATDLSPERIKNLLPPEEGKSDIPEKRLREKPRPRQERVERREASGDGPGRPEKTGPGLVAPHARGGLGPFGWLALAGILSAVIAVAAVRLHKQRRAAPAQAQEQPETGPSLESVTSRPEQHAPADLLARAEEMAAARNFRLAVRMLYASVLTHLHRGALIRLDPTRTNGEYARQLRASETAVYRPFVDMTRLFETSWYSDKPCRETDYHSCRQIAETIQAATGKRA